MVRWRWGPVAVFGAAVLGFVTRLRLAEFTVVAG